MSMYILIVTDSGGKTNAMVNSYAGLAFYLSSAVEVIGRRGVIVASKKAGDKSLTVHAN